MQVNEAQELNAALKREHASKLTELTNRTNQLQEKNVIMKQEISHMMGFWEAFESHDHEISKYDI